MKALQLPTTCYAVDYWKGDIHTGQYGPDIFSEFYQFHAARYGAFSRLVRSSFDAAIAHFDDGSIDLLHIDGQHREEDVRHDFHAWLPKLARNAVVLLHDTNVREFAFGVNRFWQEISRQHPHFEFFHGHGLGVLGMGTDFSPAMHALFDASNDPARATFVRSAYGRLGASLRPLALTPGENPEEIRLSAQIEIARVQVLLAAAEQRATALSEQLSAQGCVPSA